MMFAKSAASNSLAPKSRPVRNFILAFHIGILLLGCVGLVARCGATPDLRIDVVTYCCDCTNTGSSMCDAQFNDLNFPSLNGHILAMGSDSHRSNLLTNHNVLGIYYDTLTTLYSTNANGASSALALDQYATSLFTSTGPKPNWIVLNEISGSLWPSNQSYRTWIYDVVRNLHTNYGYSVILFAPFTNPGANNSDWQAVSSNAYIAVENYLSGQEIQAQGNSISWCQGQYQSSILSYNALGVPTSQLILGEHFGQTVTDSGFGRSGVTSNEWDSAIAARSKAAQNSGFAGYIGYAWDKNGMTVTTNEMIHFEDTYASFALPMVEPLSKPYLILQPQSQTIPTGGTDVFTGIPAGTNAVTYQWYFMDAPISGATNGSLTISNLVPANAGIYTLVLSNAAGTTTSSNVVLSVQVPPPLAYDPFASAVANNGTSYTVGANLIGQTNALGQTWYLAGPSAGLVNQPTIVAGNLLNAYLADSSGNCVAFGGTSGNGGIAARLGIFPDGSSVTNGTIYYSFVMVLSNITGLNSAGVFWAGFNNSSLAQGTLPTAVAARVYTRAVTGGFNLGLSKASSTSTDWVWDSTLHKTNEVIFVVGSYTFNGSSATDDSSSMWIDPAPATYGTANTPAAALIATNGSDISSSIIRSFLIMDRDATEPAAGFVDELRIGTNWASVTPPGPPAPLLSIAETGTNVLISWPTNSTGYILQYDPALDTTNPWTALNLPTNIIHGQYTVTNGLQHTGARYYRLLRP